MCEQPTKSVFSALRYGLPRNTLMIAATSSSPYPLRSLA
jgi:hypothetical protein